MRVKLYDYDFVFDGFGKGVLDGPTDGQTDRPTDGQTIL